MTPTPALLAIGLCLAGCVSQIQGISEADKTLILNKHNEYRRKVSPTASGMRKMSWSDALADAAEDFVSQCIAGHDDNDERAAAANIGVPVGQNFAGNHDWEAAIKGWNDENQYYDYNTGSTNTTGESVGHYTQVVLAKSSRVGCAMKDCGAMNYYVCNYAFSNMQGVKPYEDGASCADCQSKCDDDLCADCSILECKNGGTLDLNSCTCNCAGSWTGTSCETYVCPSGDPSYCGKEQPEGYPASFCDVYSNVPDECPYMCGVCTA